MFKELFQTGLNLLNQFLNKPKTTATPAPVAAQPTPTPEPVQIEQETPVSVAAKVGTAFDTVEELMANLNLKDSIKWSFLVIHHSEAKDDGNRNDFDGIREWHMKNNGWSEIAYAVVIEKDKGKYVYKVGRPLNTTQAHAVGFNKTAPGFCCVGNFDLAAPNDEQWKMMVDLAKAFQKEFNISSKKVLGHRETFDLRGVPREKECPGKFWDMDKFRSEL